MVLHKHSLQIFSPLRFMCLHTIFGAQRKELDSSVRKTELDFSVITGGWEVNCSSHSLEPNQPLWPIPFYKSGLFSVLLTSLKLLQQSWEFFSIIAFFPHRTLNKIHFYWFNFFILFRETKFDKLKNQNIFLSLSDFLEQNNLGFSFIINKSLLSDSDIVCMASLFKGLIEKIH